MTKKKQLFNTWAPNEGNLWTKFAKPALFVHTENVSVGRIVEAEIPFNIQQLNDGKTAIIVDLPSVAGVEAGLGLAKFGFRPVPLYNGIHQPPNGIFVNAVNNTDIINALVDGADILKDINFSATAPPAFLLDTNRDVELSDIDKKRYEDRYIYDNRWNIDLYDMPTAAYMKEQGISRVVVWTENALQRDLRAITNSYLDAGIEVSTYINGQIVKILPISSFDGNERKNIRVSSETKESVRKFENARFGLLLVVILAAINLIGMFLVIGEPFLWTAPSIMWLTYLWVPEIVGDIIAIALSIAYFVLYLSSHKKYKLIVAVAVFFGVDVAVLFVYALWYGLVAYTGYSFMYGVIVFVTPIVLLSMLVSGAKVYKRVEKIDEDEYVATLDRIDGVPANNRGRIHPRRRAFRSFRGRHYRGYSGYGGTGRGGYGGSGGYGGYGGGFGG